MVTHVGGIYGAENILHLMISSNQFTFLIFMKSFLKYIMKYLALAPGFKFIADNNGYEDIWYEGE